ncbi:MAG TPA: trypsin-like peptidase domain-containing protein [Candidatus Dormibacteraeota bacterium]|nr:trypsin-like peptidase domain-containing protein [Candidatus Dormibacteraeota bacterium]
MAALAALAVVVLLALGVVGGVRLGRIPNPFGMSSAQIAQTVEPSVVTMKVDQFRDGNASGAGFVYGQSDHILMSARLLTHATALTASDRSGKSYPADAVGADKTADVAEVVVNGLAAQPLKSASQAPSTGADVYVPRSSSRPMAHGVVTRIGSGVIETNIPAEASDGGEPMVDGTARVVGIVKAGSSGTVSATVTAAFDGEATAWAKSDSAIAIGPPPVTAPAKLLVLSSIGPSWRALPGSAYDNGTAWHSAWERDPTAQYGGMTVDIYLVVFATISAAPPEIPSRLADAKRNGYSTVGPLTGLGDEGTVLKKATKDEVIYELIWRDRNCVVLMYMSAAPPPPPGFSLSAAMNIAAAQEKPIASNLGSY